jgi:RimJ/RimL family protein N-acetyltransferase
MTSVSDTPVFETARLRLRPYDPGDLDAMAEMFGDPDVTAYTFLGGRDRAQTAAVLDEYMAFLAERGYGMLAIQDRVAGRYLGEVGLFVSPMGPLALRYALSRAAWGKGYAVEASIAVIDDSFERLGLDELIAGVKPENKPSLRVMEKLGFIYDRTITVSGHAFGIYSVTRDGWKARRRPPSP